jgi:hypothetical protein
MSTSDNDPTTRIMASSTATETASPSLSSSSSNSSLLLMTSLDPLDNIHDHFYYFYSDFRPSSSVLFDTASTTIHQEDAVHHHRAMHFISAGTAAAVSCATYNPLDCLRVRWQLYTPSASNSTASRNTHNLWTFGKHILKTEGLWYGLWKPGLTSNVMGMAGSAAIRLGYYETVRDSIIRIRQSQQGHTYYYHHSPNDKKNDKTGTSMILAGLLCGSVGYLVTTPFHLLKTTIQANLQQHMNNVSTTTTSATTKRGVGSLPPYPYRIDTFSSGAIKILQANHGNILSLWKGVIPLTCRGALFTCGQMVGYDGCKTLWRQHLMGNNKDDNDKGETSTLHILASISASFGASFLSAPADYVMAKYMAASSTSNSTTTSSKHTTSLRYCIQEIYTTQGILGFWRGWSIFFIRLTPVMITSSTVYEQMRRQLGLGYMS